jgi:alkanesulfonate monooxygenase
VGSYENLVARIREYNTVGIDLFFLAGYPHLEEAYRLGEHVLPHFRSERDGLVRSTDSIPELRAVNGTAGV